jgi:hypothetical protein
MKTRKHGVYAALVVVLLITAALVISCPEFLDLDGLPLTQTGENSPPPGKSYVRLSFGGNERTIMPATTMNAQSFASFKVYIKSTDNADEPEDGTTTYTYATLAAKSFTVTSTKTYNVKVDAYMTAYTGSGDVISASGTATAGPISGATTSVSVALKEKYDGSGQGTFSWALTYNSGDFSSLTTATMDIQTLTGTAVGAQVNLKTTATSTRLIDSGEYRVIVTLDGGASSQADTQTFILHIYNGMTSTWSGASANFASLNNIAYTVTFTNINGSGNTATNPVSGYTHGDLLNKSGTWPYTTSPAHGTDPTNYAFAGWYTSDGSGTNWVGLTAVNATTYRVFKTQPLYARWNDTSSPPAASVTVTFTLVDAGSTLAFDTAASISQANLQGGSTLSLTVTGAAAGSTYSWMFKGAEVSTTDTFVIEFDPDDSATFEYLIVGSHTISVEVTTPAPENRTYSKEFPLTIN